MLDLCLTEDFIMVKVYRLIVFTYIEPLNLIGYLIHRTDDKQMYGHCWNPYKNKVYTFRRRCMIERIQLILKDLSEKEKICLAREIIKRFGISDACHEGTCKQCRTDDCLCVCHV